MVIAYDRRFSSEFFAQAAAEVLLAYDIPVAMAQTAVPTQMTSYEVVERGAACGIMITASHNPYQDNGFKVKSPSGAAASPDMLAVFEKTIRDNAGSLPPQRSYADALAAGKIELYDPYPGYVEYTKRSLDIERLKAADMQRARRADVGRRRRLDPAPARRRQDPGHRDPLRAQPVVRRRQPRADRAEHRRGAGHPGRRRLRPRACCSTATRTAPARPTRRARSSTSSRSWACSCTTCSSTAACAQPVVSTINETSMVGRLGKLYDVPVYETSVGFKYVGPKMIETGAMMGGEESGGYGFGMHLPERDGIYADLLLLDLFIRRARGGPLAGFGGGAAPARHRRANRSTCAPTFTSTARPTRRSRTGCCVELRQQAPSTIAGHPVVRTDALDTNDGFKFWCRRRVMAARPLQRHGAARAGLRRGDLGRRARRNARSGRHAGPRRMTDETTGLLEDAVAIARRDPGKMLAAIAAFPDQMRAAWKLSRDLTLAERYRTATNVAVIGMGGSAVCGDLVRAIVQRPAARATRSRSATTSCRRGWASRHWSSPFRTLARRRKRSPHCRRHSSGAAPVAVITRAAP